MKNKIKLIILALTAIVLLSSCDSFFSTQSPTFIAGEYKETTNISKPRLLSLTKNNKVVIKSLVDSDYKIFEGTYTFTKTSVSHDKSAIQQIGNLVLKVDNKDINITTIWRAKPVGKSYKVTLELSNSSLNTPQESNFFGKYIAPEAKELQSYANYVLTSLPKGAK